jgi:hypothetical protein
MDPHSRGELESQASEIPPANPATPTRPPSAQSLPEELAISVPPAIARWIKTECGRAKYQMLAERGGFWAQWRLWWFVCIAALRDWRLPSPPKAPPPGSMESPD